QVETCKHVLAECSTEPSLVVKTGRGEHYYFFTDGVPVDEFTHWQQRLIARFGSDPAVTDLPRLMRLPGTLHLKDPDQPRLVELVASSGHRWTTAELAATLRLDVPAAAPASQDQHAVGHALPPTELPAWTDGSDRPSFDDPVHRAW